MRDTYHTIKDKASGLYKDKGSRFIALAFPVNSEEQIKTILADVKKQYYDARHHCYAWQLSHGETVFRFNDDGEPSGTAGKPIYGQILSAGITNVLIVVVRYFGGTKLGVRGLIDAYKGAAEDAVKQADIIEMVKEVRYRLTFNYISMNDVMKIIKDHGLAIADQDYQMQCALTFTVREARELQIVGQISAIPGAELQKLP